MSAPEWAERWIPGTCGCGGRLAEVCAFPDGRMVAVCYRSGFEIGACPAAGDPT